MDSVQKFFKSTLNKTGLRQPSLEHDGKHIAGTATYPFWDGYRTAMDELKLVKKHKKDEKKRFKNSLKDKNLTPNETRKRMQSYNNSKAMEMRQKAREIKQEIKELDTTGELIEAIEVFEDAIVGPVAAGLLAAGPGEIEDRTESVEEGETKDTAHSQEMTSTHPLQRFRGSMPSRSSRGLTILTFLFFGFLIESGGAFFVVDDMLLVYSAFGGLLSFFTVAWLTSSMDEKDILKKHKNDYDKWVEQAIEKLPVKQGFEYEGAGYDGSSLNLGVDNGKRDLVERQKQWFLKIKHIFGDPDPDGKIPDMSRVMGYRMINPESHFGFNGRLLREEAYNVCNDVGNSDIPYSAHHKFDGSGFDCIHDPPSLEFQTTALMEDMDENTKLYLYMGATTVLVTGAFLYMYWDYLPSWSSSRQASPTNDDSDDSDDSDDEVDVDSEAKKELRAAGFAGFAVGDDPMRTKEFDDEDMYVDGGRSMKGGVEISFIESLSILKELVKVELDRVIIEQSLTDEKEIQKEFIRIIMVKSAEALSPSIKLLLGENKVGKNVKNTRKSLKNKSGGKKSIRKKSVRKKSARKKNARKKSVRKKSVRKKSTRKRR